MKNYKTLLFDVDDTLLDFEAAERLALKLLLKDHKLLLTPQVEESYKEINRGLWKSFEEGRISRDEVVNTRFTILFQKYNKEVDGILLEKNYRIYLEQGHDLVNGAFELIKDLQTKYDLYVVTNGVSKTQHKRLRDSNLHSYFKNIFVSEDTGFQKPMKEFFDYVFARIPNPDIEKTLIIGDSLGADIKGGNLVGLDTCWFNLKMHPNKTNIIPTYEIQKLEDLYLILSGTASEVGTC